jgi:hypothetical protein
VALGIIVILQSAGINLTSLNVLVGAIGVGWASASRMSPATRQRPDRPVRAPGPDR